MMTEDETVADDAATRRDVVVPLRVYKTVTVFSTLFAVLSVVGGFILVDTATQRASAPASEIDVPIAVLGLGLILWIVALVVFFPINGWGLLGLGVSPKLIPTALVPHALFILFLWGLGRLFFRDRRG